MQMIGSSDKHFYVYIVTNEPRGVLYVGVTSQLPGRAYEHGEGLVDGFTKRYGLRRLVYFEEQLDAETAFRREKSLKRWRRNWKIELIESRNPTWRDVYPDAVAEHGLVL
jgi:putative endonuclease